LHSKNRRCLSQVFIEIISLIIGILFLIKGADWLVDSSSSLAKKFKISTLIIGLTVVAFGTSMPELIVNIFAALKGANEIAFGNIIGSNISNILFVLGVTALICNIRVHYSTVWKEIPFALLSVLALFILSNKFLNGIKILSLNRSDGLILLFFFGIYLYYANELIYINKLKKKKEKIKTKIKILSNKKIIFYLFSGIMLLYLGGTLTVNNSIYIAEKLKLSQFLISATIIAIGTSLPELITSITAALKKDIDLAIGNIIGSNIFNILWVLGFTSLITPITIPNFINIDFAFLLIATLLLFLFMFSGKKQELERKHGVLFILLYILYIVFIVLRG